MTAPNGNARPTGTTAGFIVSATLLVCGVVAIGFVAGYLVGRLLL